jgi:hypothetical protein
MAKKPAEKKAKAKAAPKPAAAPKAKPTAPKAKPAAKAAEKMAEPIRKAGKMLRDGAERATKNSAAISAKVIDQAEANAQQAFAAMRAAADAKSLSDILKIQSGFVKSQSARSAAHVKEVGEMIARFGRDAVEQMRGK